MEGRVGQRLLLALLAVAWMVGGAHAQDTLANTRLIVPEHLKIELYAFPADWDWEQRKARRREVVTSGAKASVIFKMDERMAKEEKREGKKVRYEGQATSLRPGSYRIVVQTRQKYLVEIFENADPPLMNLPCFLDFAVEPGFQYTLTGSASVAGSRPHISRSRMGDMVKITKSRIDVYRLTAALEKSRDGVTSESIADCVFPR